jgi:hypothetical protein
LADAGPFGNLLTNFFSRIVPESPVQCISLFYNGFLLSRIILYDGAGGPHQQYLANPANN